VISQVKTSGWINTSCQRKMTFSFWPEALTRGRRIERSVSPCSFEEDYLSSGITTREQEVLQYAREVAQEIDLADLRSRSSRTNYRDHLGEMRDHSDYIGGLLNIRDGSPALRAQSSIRDNDRNYPIIYKSMESRAKSEIPRFMRHEQVNDGYTDLRWNVTGAYGHPKLNWRLGRSYNFNVMRDGRDGTPRREYMSKVKAMRGIY